MFKDGSPHPVYCRKLVRTGFSSFYLPSITYGLLFGLDFVFIPTVSDGQWVISGRIPSVRRTV